MLHHSSLGWTAPTRFRELLDLDEDLQLSLHGFVPDFTFVLDDLARSDDDALMERAMSALGKLALLLLKRIREGADAVLVLQRWTHVLGEVAAAPNGAQALALVARYIVEVGEGASSELLGFFQALGPPAGEAIVTIAEQLRAEGREQGELEGEVRVLLRLLSRRFGAVSDEHTQRVRAGSAAQRALWIDRLLSASDIDGVFRP